MRYAEYGVTDNGYYVHAIGGPGEIWGLDNRIEDDDDQRFEHIPPSGYPAGAVAIIDMEGGPRTRCLAIFEDGTEPPAGGAEIAAADVPALLVADYGWPAGTVLDAGGMPARPRAL